MNKIFKFALMLAVMLVTLTGCREDAELAPTGAPGHPEIEAAGNYTGTWTVDVNGDVKTYPGTLTLTAGDAAYLTNVAVKCEDTSLDRSSAANIIKNSKGYKFYNELGSNEIGAAFSGFVSPEGVATINFKIVQRSGKKNVLFIYAFQGSK